MRTTINELSSKSYEYTKATMAFLIMAFALLCLMPESSFAKDLLGAAFSDDVKDSLGGGSLFWKIFILVDIILATAMAVKSKNPMVFVGVAGIAFIPAFLLKTFVF